MNGRWKRQAPSRLNSILLITLVGLAMLRPTIAESHDSHASPLSRAVGPLDDPTPLRTLILDSVISGVALLGLAVQRKHLGGDYQRTGMEGGLVLVVLATIVSTVTAGQKRIAFNAGVDWISTAILGLTLWQLVRTPRARLLACAAIVATGCVQAAQGIDQYLQFEDTWTHYINHRDEIWERQGMSLDSSQVVLYENRMKSRESQGFLPHANVAGAYLVLCGFVAGGIVAGIWSGVRGWTPWAGAGGILVVGVLTVGTYLTGSRGAVVSAVGAVGLWFISRFAVRRIRVFSGRAWLMGWLVIAGILAAGVGWGVKHDSLPDMSLDFRWQYWCGASQLVIDRALTGVGRENFGRHYLRYKLIESPEEIASPHNLFVQAAADWGLIGLTGLVWMLVSGSRTIALTMSPDRISGVPRFEHHPSSTQVRSSDHDPQSDSPLRPSVELQDRTTASTHQTLDTHGEYAGRFVPWIGIGLMVLTLIRLPLLGHPDADYLYYQGIGAGLVWVLGFTLLVLPMLLDPSGRSQVDETSPGPADHPGRKFVARSASETRPDHRPAASGIDSRFDRSLRIGIGLGALSFLIHELINFALFVPGSATAFFALIGCCGGHAPIVRGAGPADSPVPNVPRRDAHAAAFLGTSILLFVTTIVLGIAPVSRCVALLGEAREAMDLPPGDPSRRTNVESLFERAGKADPWDSTPFLELAQWIKSQAVADHGSEVASRGLQAARIARERDPHNFDLWRLTSNLQLLHGRRAGGPPALLDAVGAAREAVNLYPTDPAGRIFLADVESEVGERLGRSDLIGSALGHYQEALNLDAARPWWERIRRLNERQRTHIEDARRRLILARE